MQSDIEYHDLTVITGDKAAENFVLDSQYHRIASDIGERCVFRLPAGMYLVKVRTGSESDQMPIVLSEDKEVTFEQLKFFSPAPLEATNATTSFQVGKAENYSKRNVADVIKGSGSKIFLFGTVYENTNINAIDKTRDPATGLTLRDAADKILVDFGDPQIGAYSFDGEPWAACDVDIDPGIYTLCVETAAKETYKLTIVACANWQTQVFLQPRNYGHTESDIRTDLVSSSVFMCRFGEGFVASSRNDSFEKPDFRLTELLRQGLLNRRNVISKKVYNSLFNSKLDNPMLGIYAAHTLLLNNEYNASELKTLTKQLRSLVGNAHPDVEAIALKLGMGSQFTFNCFPMLYRSWNFILEASVDNKSLIPKNSPAYKYSGQFWNCDLWLVWGISYDEHKKKPAAQLIKMIAADVFRRSPSPSISLLRRLTDAVLNWLPFFAAKYVDIEKLVNSDAILTISKSLGIPKSKIIEILKGVSNKEFDSKKEIPISNATAASNDPQKNQWGGKPEVNSRKLSAIVEKSITAGFYAVTLTVESTDINKPLTGEVKFYLHDTFFNPEPIEKVKDGKAVLKLHGVWGSFTVGAAADNDETKLELDLAELPGITEEFKNN